MWKVLPEDNKDEYKKIILAFASLTEAFSQKSIDDTTIPSPIVNSKFQEAVFQKAFGAIIEDIGNTSYDASLKLIIEDQEYKFLIGIKTFGIQSGDQKIAQFKAISSNFSGLLDNLKTSRDVSNNVLKEELDELNKDIYLKVAKEISRVRNERIESAIKNLKGFKVEENEHVHSVYHVLMPSAKGENPKIYVGETSYDKIDIKNIDILGSTSINHPSNFIFTDGKHIYKYTSADSQLYMKFDNKNIVVDEWQVKYVKDAYKVFSNIGEQMCKDEIIERNIESYSWLLLNNNGEVERFSGFNSFFGTGPKLPKDLREKRCEDLLRKYDGIINYEILHEVVDKLKLFLLNPSQNNKMRDEKVILREMINYITYSTENMDFYEDVCKLMYRPMNELYIPIPNSKLFHMKHQSFFAKDIGKIVYDKKTKKEVFKLNPDKEKRKFNLIFEPSGDSIVCYIAQDSGKAIESYKKQSYLGKWILRDLFQLQEYQPLNRKKLDELGINGIRLYKEVGKDDVHLQFIWIDEDNLPEDFIQ